MADTNQRKAFKGGIGMAVAVVLAWAVGEFGGVDMPDMVVAAVGSVIGTIAAAIREKV